MRFPYIFAYNIKRKIEKELCNKMLQKLSIERAARILRYVNWQDQQRSLVGEIMVRMALQSMIEMKISKKAFITNKYGKPILESKQGIHYNVSHSGQWVVCALDDSEIGIDVEEVREIELDIARNYFSKEECKGLFNVEVEGRLNEFYRIWTLKESFIKAVGTGLSMPLDSFSILRDKNGKHILKKNGRENKHEWHLRSYDFDHKHMLAVCSKKKRFNGKIIEIKDKDIREYLSKS